MGLFLFGVSGGEIFLVLFIVLLLFGADKIPELVRSFGKGMNEFKKAADEIKRELSDTATDLRREAIEMANDVTHEVREAGEGLDVSNDLDPYKQLDEKVDQTEELPQSPRPVSRRKLIDRQPPLDS